MTKSLHAQNARKPSANRVSPVESRGFRDRLRRVASAESLSKSLVVAAVIGGALLAGAPACSSSDKSSGAPTPACDSSKCAAGNTCLTYQGETKCRKTCASNSDPSSSCPFNYTCVPGEDGGEAFCRKDTSTNGAGAELAKGTGQWGASCLPMGGLAENPACDSAQGFQCYGVATTDADAYCTKYDCAQDSDCGAGFYCAAINASPNVESDERVVGETVRACLRRDYCAPCTADFDCGQGQHCVGDADGAGFCTNECSQGKNCPSDAVCADIGIGPKVCFPRAQRCVGDGSLCSPCRSDADCGEDGACVQGPYTTERSCAKKSTITCTLTTDLNGKPIQKQGVNLGCPALPGDLQGQVGVGCRGRKADDSTGLSRIGVASVPADYCTGMYAFGTDYNVGCWSRQTK
ncbi:hypothetical protein [Labilithrix luteola]|nr:hypothetical protein [Labilithrix luteola]